MKTQEAVLARLKGNYLGAQYHFVQFLSEHLADCARVFDGDLQEMLVLSVIGQSSLASFVDGASPAFRSGISAARIADVSGIPRQTVRRKLAALSAQGWVRHLPGIGWQIVIDVDVDGGVPAQRTLSELENRAFERLARLVVALDRLPPAPMHGAAGAQNGHPDATPRRRT